MRFNRTTLWSSSYTYSSKKKTGARVQQKSSFLWPIPETGLKKKGKDKENGVSNPKLLGVGLESPHQRPYPMKPPGGKKKVAGRPVKTPVMVICKYT
jgi:hypothetical protein